MMYRRFMDDRQWQVALLGLATAAIFLLLHPYAGLVHDARLYTFQALNYLAPDLYHNDVFVRFGSQDDYTLFSPLFAFASTWLGTEQAAAAITLVATFLFLAAAWTLARTLLPPRQAAVALLLLVTLPGHYGPARIFHYIESFISPRLLAEASTLFCLVAWLKDQRVLAVILAIAAMLIHPIMGSAGPAIIASLEFIGSKWRRFWPVAALGVLLVALALSGWLPISQWQFDSEWYQIVMRRSYLGLHYWEVEDWARIATVLATLAAAAFVLKSPLKRIALATLTATLVLLLVAWVGGDILRFIIVVQAQAWRFLWMATVLAIVLLPAMFASGWRANALARVALLLIASTWITSAPPAAFVAATLAVVAAAFSNAHIPPRSSKIMLAGSWAFLTLVVGHGLAVDLLAWNDGLTQVAALPPLQDELLTLAKSGLAPLLAVAASVWLVRSPRRAVMQPVMAAVLVVVICALLPANVGSWTTVRYDEDLVDSYATWRSLIPPGSDVMWTSEESPWGDGATNTWLLLQRPAFLSGTQAPNALFSRGAAIEMNARAETLWGALPFVHPFRPRGERTSEPPQPIRLRQICDASSVRYVVTSAKVGDASPIPAPSGVPTHLRDFNLYICT